ncbi:MAG TPA: VTT domain-containing protein [Polyangiaceae bacterium]|nr:VTT domain-containing protein [Polyangiaceae bacterium]
MTVMNSDAEPERSAVSNGSGPEGEDAALDAVASESRAPESTAEGSRVDGASAASNRRSRTKLIVRFALGLVALLTLVVLVVRTLRPELEGIGKWFVERFGLVGVAAGTFIADGFHFPVPPQFYMLLAIAAQTNPIAILAATSLGSVLGGGTGYLVARRLGHIRVLSRWLERVGGGVGERLGQRYPYRSAVLASVSPMAFSVLCYMAGLFKVRRGPLLVLLALRLPKIALYYYLVRIGWSLS